MLLWNLLPEIIDNMYLYGASGHAKVIIDIANANKLNVEGLFDDNKSINKLMEYQVLETEHIKNPLIISIGDNKIRKNIVDKLLNVKYCQALIHPSAIISSESILEEGTVVMQGSIIQSCVSIGKHCIINTAASIDHDCKIADYVHVSPHATLCGNVKVGEGAWIGAGAVIVPGVEIGCWSVIGAGSVVTKNIPDNVMAVGNRAKIIKKINI